MNIKPVSVVIPTYNRAKEIEITLPSYCDTSFVKEVLLINNGSTDNTSDVIAKAALQFDFIKEIKLEKKVGAQKAKQLGLKYVENKYILIGEDDVLLSDNYIKICCEFLNKNTGHIIAGNLIHIHPNIEKELAVFVSETKGKGFPQDISPFRIHEDNFGTKDYIEIPFVHAVAMIKADIIEASFFDDWYKGNGFREETDFFLNARRNGAKIFFTNTTSCYHLRGCFSRTGGQRMNRLATEFISLYNTFYFLKKHWSFLSADFSLKGGPFWNTLIYSANREKYYLKRLFKSLTGVIYDK